MEATVIVTLKSLGHITHRALEEEVLMSPTKTVSRALNKFLRAMAIFAVIKHPPPHISQVISVRNSNAFDEDELKAHNFDMMKLRGTAVTKRFPALHRYLSQNNECQWELEINGGDTAHAKRYSEFVLTGFEPYQSCNSLSNNVLAGWKILGSCLFHAGPLVQNAQLCIQSLDSSFLRSICASPSQICLHL